jgi:hypothetical protein
MASLQQLKNRLSGITSKEPTPEKTTISKKLTQTTSLPSPTLEIEEARYLLSLIAKSDFSGKDIQIVYNTALKLQEILQENLNKENDNG